MAPDFPQPRYFPFMHGVYDVKAGITALSKDHGNGPVDLQVFQLDEHFPAYRQAKLKATREHAGRHVLRAGLMPQDVVREKDIGNWVATQLATEHPRDFRLDAESQTLHCERTNEQVALASGRGLLDRLALQVQEDWALIEVGDNGGNQLWYLNVCMPSGWPPEEKIGRPFAEVHAPVPHAQPLNAKQDSIAKLMINATRGAVRFAWTITTDAVLNHHPLYRAELANDEAAASACSLFEHQPGEPLLRVERQVIWGFPQQRAALFTIRTYLYRFTELEGPTRAALAKAVAGMSDASLAYKNMDRELILTQLAQ